MMRDGYDNTSESSGLFARDGHLTMLSLDRFDTGELSVAGCEMVIDHLRACGVCSDRVEEMRLDVGLLPPPELVESRPNTVAIGTLAIVATVAAAAALLLVVLPQPQQASRQPGAEGVLTASPYTTTTAELDGLSAGGSLDVRVAADGATEPLRASERVPFADALSIDVRPTEAGFVAVLVSTDPSDDEADGTGGMEMARDVQVLLPATRVEAGGKEEVEYRTDAPNLASAVTEHVVVIACPERFTVGEGEDALNLDVPAPDGCSTYELELRRFAEVADS